MFFLQNLLFVCLTKTGRACSKAALDSSQTSGYLNVTFDICHSYTMEKDTRAMVPNRRLYIKPPHIDLVDQLYYVFANLLALAAVKRE